MCLIAKNRVDLLHCVNGALIALVFTGFKNTVNSLAAIDFTLDITSVTTGLQMTSMSVIFSYRVGWAWSGGAC